MTFLELFSKKSHLFASDSGSGSSPIMLMDERTRLTSEPSGHFSGHKYRRSSFRHHEDSRQVTELFTLLISNIFDGILRTQKDATVVGMGDELTLQIELRDPTQSAFGIFARNLYARSTNGESLFLLDNTGYEKCSFHCYFDTSRPLFSPRR